MRRLCGASAPGGVVKPRRLSEDMDQHTQDAERAALKAADFAAAGVEAPNWAGDPCRAWKLAALARGGGSSAGVSARAETGGALMAPRSTFHVTLYDDIWRVTLMACSSARTTQNRARSRV